VHIKKGRERKAAVPCKGEGEGDGTKLFSLYKWEELPPKRGKEKGGGGQRVFFGRNRKGRSEETSSHIRGWPKRKKGKSWSRFHFSTQRGELYVPGPLQEEVLFLSWR